MEQKHLQVRQCKGPDLSNVYNINYSDLCLFISKNQRITTFIVFLEGTVTNLAI